MSLTRVVLSPKAPRVGRDGREIAAWADDKFCSMELMASGGGRCHSGPTRRWQHCRWRAGWVGDGYDACTSFAPDGQRIGQILLPEIVLERLLR